MEVSAFVKWSMDYIKSEGWNIPVTTFSDTIRIGVKIAEYSYPKPYDEYSIQSIYDAKTIDEQRKLKSLVKFNLERMRIRLKSIDEYEKMRREIREQFGYS